MTSRETDLQKPETISSLQVEAAGRGDSFVTVPIEGN